VLAVVFDRDSFLSPDALRVRKSASSWAGLLDLGVVSLAVRKGDDLVRVFNP